ncbi:MULTISPECIES: helix-turn-helix domain-containing protein [Clostridia]|jgi:excisionase family DNA binding protein|uniref:helix-turn-helix domain-containing protein n=1 Tax=Clostridia TaxID=186801 RepID=UPI001956F74A|nr:helix-turn-helix domain-containing protein [Defluviitalea raffinosedens]MBM7686205.1 excisionase family DNA binding protein [Defluviitalea raffinosedens]
MSDQAQEKWSSIDEIAEHLGVSKDTIRNWIKKNEMPAYKIGKQWRFRISEVDQWVKRGDAKI